MLSSVAKGVEKAVDKESHFALFPQQDMSSNPLELGAMGTCTVKNASILCRDIFK
jgi:hypothetical protein